MVDWIEQTKSFFDTHRKKIIFLVIGLVVVSCLLIILNITNKVTVPYHAEKQNIWTYPFKTGDLFLFSKKVDPLLSANRALKLFTKTTTNHVGVVYVEPHSGHVYVWDMNITGPRLASLSSLVDGSSATNQHHFLVRPLNKPADSKLFQKIIRQQWDAVYDYDIGLATYHRFFPILPFLRGHEWNCGKQRHCAHFVVEMYAKLGVLDMQHSLVDPSSYIPADFSQEYKKGVNIPLTSGYKFGNTVMLVE